MIAVVQRVLEAKVTVAGDIVGAIGEGLLVLADGAYAPGHHLVDWSSAAGSRLDPGLYFIRLTVPGRTLVRRFVLMK